MIYNKKYGYSYKQSIIALLFVGSGYICQFSYADKMSESSQLHVDIGYFNKTKFDLTLRIPTSQAYGFSNKANTPAQQAKVDAVVKSLNENISSIVTTEQATGCKYEVNKIDPFEEGNGKVTEFVEGKGTNVKNNYWVLSADVTVKCDSDVRGKYFTVNLPQISNDITTKLIVEVNGDGSHTKKFVLNGNYGSFKM